MNTVSAAVSWNLRLMDGLDGLVPVDFECLGTAREFADDIHEIFSKVPLLEGFDASETQLLCNFMVCYSAPRGAKLIQQGDVGEYMFFLLTGHADVFVQNGVEPPVRVATIGPGTAVGDMSMIDHRPRASSCVAVEPVDLVLLSSQAFKDIMLTLPRLGNKLLMVLLHSVSERLHALQERAAEEPRAWIGL